MATVKVYLPDAVKEAALEVDPPINFSEVLRLGLAERLRQAKQQGEERRAS